MNKFFIILFAFISTTTQASNVLCLSNELTYFSCTMTNNKILSLCGISHLKENQVTYKFGTANKIEFIYPNYLNANNLLTYNHYMRYQTDYYRVKFSNNEYLYEIFKNYNGEEANNVRVGIIITKENTQKEYRHNCKTINVDNLNQLSSILLCDKDNALGCDE